MKQQRNSGRSNVRTDAGLSAYMASIYRYMALGLGLTALVAYLPQIMGFQAQKAFYSFEGGGALYSLEMLTVSFFDLSSILPGYFAVQRSFQC